MSSERPNEGSILNAARKISSQAARGTFLEVACQGDPALKARVEELLAEGQTVIGSDPNPDLQQSPDDPLGSMPRVLLRDESPAEGDPIVHLASTEMPKHEPGGRYQVQGEIARGGIGAILKGRDTNLGRDLAIKVLLEQHKDRPEVVQRFVEEAQIGGQLQHPGIAPIYELGQFADKRPFFSMKLVKGETLSKLLADRRSPSDERARFVGIFEQICQTMAYAHSRGVIHRDLKPANVMVGAFGEVQVMDWGLAKVLQAGGVADERMAQGRPHGQSIVHTLRSGVGSDASPMFGSVGSHTQMGSVMGTPAYMPPEQALGEVDRLNERTDVFGLGAILCEILTGRPPYVGDSGLEVFRLASRGKLDDCFRRLDACGADADLVALSKSCLAPEPTDRPRDAGVLAERVTGYLESVEAKLRSAEIKRAAEAARADAEAAQAAAERQRAEAESQRAEAQAAKAQAESARAEAELARANEEQKRRRASFALTAAFLLLAGLGGGGWLYIERQESNRQTAEADTQRNHAAEMRALAEQREEQRKAAEMAHGKAEAEKLRSLSLLADMQTERGLQAAREGQAAKASLWFANAAALTPHDRDRQAANQRRAQTWSDAALVPVALIKAGQDVTRIAFQPGGSLMMTVQADGLRMWDWRDETALPWSLQLPPANDAAFSPDGKTIAALLGTGEVRLLDPASGAVHLRFQATGGLHLIEWSPDGMRVAVAGNQLQVWNVGGKPVLESSWPHSAKITGMRFSRSGRRIVSCSGGDRAQVFAINEAGLPAPLYPAMDHFVPFKRRQATPAFCDDDRRLVTTSSATKRPVLRDAATGTALPVDWKLPPNMERSIEPSPDGRWVSVGGWMDVAILSVDGRTNVVLRHGNHLEFTLFAPDGQSLATSSYEGITRLYPLRDLGNAEVGPPTVIPHHGTFSVGALSPDSLALAIASEQQVVIWERKSVSPVVGTIDWSHRAWRPRPSFDGQFVTPGVYHEYPMQFSPQRTRLTVARMADGSAAGPSIGLKGLLHDSCVCTDNASVAVVSGDQEQGWLDLFDIASGTSKRNPIALTALPLSVAARPGRPQVAVLCENGDLLVVNTATGRIEQTLEHPGISADRSTPVARVAYSPDGSTIVAVLGDQRVAIRDAQSGALRCPLLKPMIESGKTRSIAFSPDSRYLATAVSGKNMAQVWDLATGEKVGVGMSHPGDIYGLWSIRFSPDGKRLVTGHKDGRIRTFDWRTGELVGKPLQHPDEVFDIAFTPDGRQLLACVRLGTLHVWDVASEKLAVPLIPGLNPKGQSTDTLAVAGDRVVVCGFDRYTVLSLPTLLPPIEEDVPSLLRRAELATNQKLQVGELVPLELQEWSGRWQELVATRQTPETVAESLAQSFDAATDVATQSLVIARAARRGVIERLQTLRPTSLPLKVALALYWSRQGRHSNVERLRSEVLGQLRQLTAKGSVEPYLKASIAELLTYGAPSGPWTTLETTVVKGSTVTEFTRQPEGFVLAAIGNAKPVTFSIESRPAVKQIAAFRLDVAPHSSLPGGGAGYDQGNFHLTEVRARLRRAGGSETPLKFSGAATDYIRDTDPVTNEADGPWGVLDGDQSTRWDVAFEWTEPHWLVLDLESPCDVGENDTLIVELDSGTRQWPMSRLGHFRLSVSEESHSGRAYELIAAVRQHHLTSDQKLAAASLLNRETQVAINILANLPTQADSRDRLLNALLQATAQYQLGHLEASRQFAEAGVLAGAQESYPNVVLGFLDNSLRRFSQRKLGDLATLKKIGALRQMEAELIRLTREIEANPSDPVLLLTRATDYIAVERWDLAKADWQRLIQLQPDQLQQAFSSFRDAGQWSTAAEFGQQLIEQKPKASLLWLTVGTVVARSGDDRAYAGFCRWIAKQEIKDVEMAERAIKTSLLRSRGFDLAALPTGVLVDALDSGRHPQSFATWGWSTRALLAYRSGNPRSAIDFATKAEREMPTAFTRGMTQSVVAMAHQKLNQPEQARTALAEAAQTIAVLKNMLGTSFDHDLLVAEILRQEAEAQITGQP